MLFFAALFSINFIGWGQCTTSPCGFVGAVSTRNTNGTISSNNVQYTWTVPCGVSSVTIKCWGGGGGGAGSGSNSAKAGGGGGGGGFSQSTLSVSPGDVLYIQVGQGGVLGRSSNTAPDGVTTCSNCSNAGSGGISYVKTVSQSGTTICLANGGNGGVGGSNGANGGSGANTTNAVSNAVAARSGGNGGNGNGSSARAGGGGGSGGFGGNGGNASSTGCSGCGGNGTGGAPGAAGAGSPGYAGATATSCASSCGSYSGVSPNSGFYGSGAAGGSRNGSNQQNGANGSPGYVEISFVVSNPTNGLVFVNGNSDPSQVIDVCVGSSISVSQSGWNNQGGTTYFYSDLAAALWGWEDPNNGGWTIIDYGNITTENQVGGQTSVNNSSSFNFKINTTGIFLLHTNAESPTGCYAAGVNRYIRVNSLNTATSLSPSACINEPLPSNLTITTTGATGIGAPTNLPTGVNASWLNNTITISGTPTTSGSFNFSIPLTGGCGTVNASGTLTINAPPSIDSISPP